MLSGNGRARRLLRDPLRAITLLVGVGLLSFPADPPPLFALLVLSVVLTPGPCFKSLATPVNVGGPVDVANET